MQACNGSPAWRASQATQASIPAALFSKTLVRNRSPRSNAQSNLRLAISIPNTIMSASINDCHGRPTVLPCATTLTHSGSLPTGRAYDTVQIPEAQKNEGRLLFATESKLLDTNQYPSFAGRPRLLA